jgi:hypothetical protein
MKEKKNVVSQIPRMPISRNGCNFGSLLETHALAHELGNHPMEVASLVTKSLLSCAECSEVFGSFGSNVGAKLKGDATDIFATDFHVEENLGIGHVHGTSREGASSDARSDEGGGAAGGGSKSEHDGDSLVGRRMNEINDMSAKKLLDSSDVRVEGGCTSHASAPATHTGQNPQ